MRTDALVTGRDNENEHRELEMLSSEGQLAVFIIVGAAALLTLLTSPNFRISSATAFKVHVPLVLSLRRREDALLLGKPH